MVTLRLSEVVILRGRIAKRLREKASELGVSVDEYVVEMVTSDLDPIDRAIEYVEAARDLIEEAREELRKGDTRQAAEKLWGAATLAVKAYAYWKERKRLSSHGELWEYKRKLARELGRWIHNSWANAAEMHICFYEGWCAAEDVENALEQVKRLVEEIASQVGRQ